jgi:hypothetical protein
VAPPAPAEAPPVPPVLPASPFELSDEHARSTQPSNTHKAGHKLDFICNISSFAVATDATFASLTALNDVTYHLLHTT